MDVGYAIQIHHENDESHWQLAKPLHHPMGK
jgi:hypothetical protein